jgi:hypothetical protein
VQVGFAAMDAMPASLPWQARVEQTAIVALADFTRLASTFDFVAEGRRSLAEHFRRLEAAGGDPAQIMCFTWYFDDGESSPS